MSREVYITRLSKFLPNQPISNEEMEDYLGMVDGKPSKARRIVLRSNGIKTRYYAMDKSGRSTHSNAQLVAEAVRGLFDEKWGLKDMELMACGTTSPDQLLPSHATMVQGELGAGAIEVISNTGACCSGTHSMKYGFLSVLSGSTSSAVCTGSEKLSTWMLAKKFDGEAENLQALEKEPIIAFEKDFLRWMLSDGAAAALLQDKPNEKGPSLRIEWIDNYSFAGELETCMYAGAEKLESGDLKGWNDSEDVQDWINKSIFSLKQDVRMLGENIVPYGAEVLSRIVKKRNFDVSQIDYFLPHLSSEFFRDKVYEETRRRGMDIPAEKWFTNLTEVGNVGSASIYLMLEELFNSGRLKKGEKILLMVPESARFLYAYALLTVC